MSSQVATADIAVLGLAVMGENLILNMESKGFTVACYNRTVSKVDDFVKGNVSISMVIEAQPDESSLVSWQILHASRHRGGPVLNLPLEGSPHPIAFGADAHVDLKGGSALSMQYYR